MNAPAGEPPRYKGWAGIRRAFGTPSALTLALLGFGCGLPFLPVASMTLSTRLRAADGPPAAIVATVPPQHR